MRDPQFSVLFIAPTPKFEGLLAFLNKTSAAVVQCHQLPAVLTEYSVVVADPEKFNHEEQVRLTEYLTNGGSCLGFFSTPSSVVNYAPIFGARPGTRGPFCEVRVIFTDPSHPLKARLPEAFYVSGEFLPLERMYDEVQVILYADWQYDHLPMFTLRSIGAGLAAATTIQDYDQATFQRFIYRLLRHLAGLPYPDHSLHVGLLGYPTSVGHLHAQAAYQGTPGLLLKTICDLSPARREAARKTYHRDDVHIIDDAQQLAQDSEIDIVIISTPPNSHAKLALQMLEGGKHVVIEKPLALTSAETSAMIELANSNKLLLCCHQNRRWDEDFRAIKLAVEEGVIGELFYTETFIGGYGHPCGFWHSEEAISGGTSYDWGAHYLDWIMDLMPGTISEIVCHRHKRVWQDITNSDQEQIMLKFDDGRQAEFLHSDLAFIPKPKWYLLGTSGTIIGHWRELTTYEYDPLIYYQSHPIPSAELGADLQVRRLLGRHQIIEQTLPSPPKLVYPFHHNLADYLLLGEPVAIPIEHTARVVAVLETAKRSAENSGSVEKVEI